MSQESVKVFIKKMNSDKTFVNKISKAVSDTCVVIAKEEGIDITEEELQDAFDLLNDEQLDKVVGGFGLAQGVNVNGVAFANHPINADE